jgi:hypothetical protein
MKRTSEVVYMVKNLVFNSIKLNYNCPILMENYCENESLFKTFIKKGDGPTFNIVVLMI